MSDLFKSNQQSQQDAEEKFKNMPQDQLERMASSPDSAVSGYASQELFRRKIILQQQEVNKAVTAGANYAKTMKDLSTNPGRYDNILANPVQKGPILGNNNG